MNAVQEELCSAFTAKPNLKSRVRMMKATPSSLRDSCPYERRVGGLDR